METERRLYLALHSLYNLLDTTDMDDEMRAAYLEADGTLTQFELELGPVPDWASGHNIAQEPLLYAQLYTRNGRERGNGMIYDTGVNGELFGVITDMGNTSVLSRAELLACYDIGDFILNEEGYLKRKRQQDDYEDFEPSVQ